MITGVKKQRNLIPLLAQDGSMIKDSWIRIDDPSLEVIENGTAQLTISWRSRRPYQQNKASKTQNFYLDIIPKERREINDNQKE